MQESQSDVQSLENNETSSSKVDDSDRVSQENENDDVQDQNEFTGQYFEQKIE